MAGSGWGGFFIAQVIISDLTYNQNTYYLNGGSPMDQLLIKGLVCLALLAGLVGTDQATAISFNFSGTITGVADNDNLLDGSIIVGDAFSGTFSYESSIPDNNPDPTVYGGVLSTNITSVVTAGNYVFQGDPGTIDLANQSSDFLGFLFRHTSNPPIDLGPTPGGNIIRLSFGDDSGTVFSDDVLPTSLDLSNFISASIDLRVRERITALVLS